MPVDVFHGDRRQVPSLPHSRAEPGHHQGVSAQLIEEVAVDGQTIDAQNLRQDLGEGAFGARHRVGAPLLSQDRKSTRLNSSHSQISYAVFCLKKKKIQRVVLMLS